MVIASPNATHAPLATLALTPENTWWWINPSRSICRKRAILLPGGGKQLLLSVFHNRRWDSDFGHWDVITQGTLGKVKLFESHIDRFRPEVRVRWREQNVPGSGLWFDWGRT